MFCSVFKVSLSLTDEHDERVSSATSPERQEISQMVKCRMQSLGLPLSDYGTVQIWHCGLGRIYSKLCFKFKLFIILTHSGSSEMNTKYSKLCEHLGNLAIMTEMRHISNGYHNKSHCIRIFENTNISSLQSLLKYVKYS